MDYKYVSEFGSIMNVRFSLKHISGRIKSLDDSYDYLSSDPGGQASNVRWEGKE